MMVRHQLPKSDEQGTLVHSCAYALEENALPIKGDGAPAPFYFALIGAFVLEVWPWLQDTTPYFPDELFKVDSKVTKVYGIGQFHQLRARS